MAIEPTDETRSSLERFTLPVGGEVYDEGGNLVVGEEYETYSPARRRLFNARNMAFLYNTDFDDNRLAIALGLFPEPEGESRERRNQRMTETRQLALDLADAGYYDVAIELGVLPKPKVEPEPRMVDADGKLVQEAIEIEF